MEIIVVGAGPAGMMAAIEAAQTGSEVVVLEKMNRPGSKLSITGKGRGNITNIAEHETFIKNIFSLEEGKKGGRFLNSVLRSFGNQDVIGFFEGLGVPVKIERGGRVFPQSDSAKDVLAALLRRMEELHVKLITSAAVKNIVPSLSGFLLETGKGDFTARSVIIATGGASYHGTGSSGDGFRLAKSIGHSVTKILPALVPLETEEEWVGEAAGLSLKNVRVRLLADNQKIADDFGEMLFTHFGVSGPVILTMSRAASWALSQNAEVCLSVDLKPALDEKTLNRRLLRDISQFAKKSAQNALKELLPQKLIGPVLDYSYISPDAVYGSLTKAERLRLLGTLKNLILTVTKTRPIDEAIVTAGGVSLKEVNPKSMESKIVPGIFFAGEVLDVDGLTGGYNLTVAFSTGYTAGKFASSKV